MNIKSFKNVVLPMLFLLLPFANSVHLYHKHGRIFLGIGAECKNQEGYFWQCGPGLWCGPNGVCEVEKTNELRIDEQQDHIFTENVFSGKKSFHEDSEHLPLESAVTDERLHVNAGKVFEENPRTPSYDELLHATTDNMFAKKPGTSQDWMYSQSGYHVTHLNDEQDDVGTMTETMEYPTEKENKNVMLITPRPLDDHELRSIANILPIIHNLFGDKLFSSMKHLKVHYLSDGNSHKTTVPSLNVNEKITPESSTSSHENSDSVSHDEKGNEPMKIEADVFAQSTYSEFVIDNPLFVGSTEHQPVLEPTSTHETHFDLHDANILRGSGFVSSASNSHSIKNSTQTTNEEFAPHELRDTSDDTQSFIESRNSVVDHDFSNENTSSVNFISTNTIYLKLSSNDENSAHSEPSKSSDGDSLSPEAGENSAVDLAQFFYDVTPTPSLESESVNFQPDPSCSFGLIAPPSTHSDKSIPATSSDNVLETPDHLTTLKTQLPNGDSDDDGDKDVDRDLKNLNFRLDPSCSLEFIPLPSTQTDKSIPVASFDSDLETPDHLTTLNTPLPDGDSDDDGDMNVDRVHDIMTVMNSTLVDNDETSNSHSPTSSQSFTKTPEVNSTEQVFNLQSIVTPVETATVSSSTQQSASHPQTNKTPKFSSSPLKQEKAGSYHGCNHLITRLLNPLCFFINLISK